MNIEDKKIIEQLSWKLNSEERAYINRNKTKVLNMLEDMCTGNAQEIALVLKQFPFFYDGDKKDIEKLRNFCPEDNEQTREYIDKIKSILKSIDFDMFNENYVVYALIEYAADLNKDNLGYVVDVMSEIESFYIEELYKENKQKYGVKK